MNNIERILPFSESDTDRRNYTLSLLTLCCANGIIGNAQALEIKEVISNLFTETAEQFTKRESSSLPVATAEKIYRSTLYRADVYLLSLNNLSAAVEILRNTDFREILARGSNLIVKYYDDVKKIYQRAKKSKIKNSLYEYNYMMNRAFPEFYKSYSARFDALGTNTSIDYPTLYKPAYDFDCDGLLFIREYYTDIMLENEFCSFFSSEDIEKVLETYAKINNCKKYSSLLFNICEVVLDNFLAGLLLGKSDFEIIMHDSEILREKYRLFTLEQIKSTVRKEFGQYYKILKNHQLISYLRPYTDIFSEKLYTHLKNSTLSAFIGD